MPELFGNAEFPGIGQIESASITLTHGITPSVAVLTMLPQANQLAEYGTLRFTFGSFTRDFIECKADYGSAEFNSAGETWRIGIFDRRWKWLYSQIGGEYNVRNPDNTVKPLTEKTPQELAALCIEAMGEDPWEIGDLPNDSRPSVAWDVDNPAEALTKLCESLNCRVVPYMDRKSGRICRLGQGAELPGGGEINVSTTFDPPEKPDEIVMVCGHDEFELDLELEPVGEENDGLGTIKPIDELTYRPTNGWASVEPKKFAKLIPENARDLAIKSVWRWYRVRIPDGGIFVPGYAKRLTSIDQIWLTDHRVDTTDDPVREALNPGGAVLTVNKRRQQAAIVDGYWYDSDKDATATNNSAIQKVKWAFSIDAARRMVVFTNPVYENQSTGMTAQPVAANIQIHAACNVKEPETLAPLRSVKRRKTGASFGTGEWLVMHPEIVVGYTATAPWGVNLGAVNAELDYYLDAEMRRFQATTPQSATYMGLIDVELDGAIQQITYTVNAGGAETTVSRNTEELTHAGSYQEHRALEKQRDMIRQLAKQAKADAARWVAEQERIRGW